MFTFVTLW